MRMNWKQAGRVLLSVVIALAAVVLLAYVAATAGWWAGTYLHGGSLILGKHQRGA